MLKINEGCSFSQRRKVKNLSSLRVDFFRRFDMSDSRVNRSSNDDAGPPPLRQDASGRLDTASLADAIQWFMDYDQRVAVIRHPRVEEVFHWKQDESRRAGEDIFNFDRAEDRLAIGIFQALAENPTEHELHGWISQLLNALDEASKMNEEISSAYKLDLGEVASVVKEAEKIPAARGRTAFLTSCWIETLCTAEVRVLGWMYRELYGRPYAPQWIDRAEKQG